ncbi:FecCD family ABC transporter permease [Rhodomicrobium sp.]|uniref:FecCD family ABC transporter permease n=1 Tax=Rhodomicrobium sp. TaxID=2720632 RepID=UPI0039E5642B
MKRSGHATCDGGSAEDVILQVPHTDSAVKSAVLAPRRKWPVTTLALFAVAALLAVLSLGAGPVALSPDTVTAALFGAGTEPQRIIVQEIRLPRAVLALAIGAILGLSGAALQGLLRNPLASPALFGAPQAAAFGAVVVIATGLADALSFALPVAAIAAAFASVFVLLAVAGRNANLLILILAGLALSALAGAGTALAVNLAPNPYAALEITFWLLGSLEDRSFQHVALALPFILAGAAILLANRNALRTLSLGEEAAQSLGVDVARLRLAVIAGVALGVGGAVAVSGTIGFIGLVAPHLARPLVGHDPARLLLPSAAIGAALLLAADIAVRLIPSTTDIKVGVLTAIIGVPFFLYLIVRDRRALTGGLS